MQESQNDKIRRMLIIAYSMGYEAGHHDTVESVFYGDGNDSIHDAMSSEVIDEAVWTGCFDRDLRLT